MCSRILCTSSTVGSSRSRNTIRCRAAAYSPGGSGVARSCRSASACWARVSSSSPPTGGNTVVTANLELRVPSPIFPDRVRLGLFVDVGQVWERGDTLTAVSGLRVTPGLGLRFITPLGPVRLDAAYNGYPQEPGPLYLLDNTNKSLTAVLDPTGKQLLLRPRLPSGFWRRVVVQFAVGQAF